jgi:response regulator RpfG family c-di-GMP phosphodiesterase
MDPERGERDEALYRSHPHVGANLIARSGIPDAGSVAEAVRFHLTPFDGRGAGTAAETIPLAARILAIASAFDSLLGGRPGRPAMSVQRALRGILEQRARDFDPVLVDRFIELVRRLEAEHPDLVKALEGEFDERELAAQ